MRILHLIFTVYLVLMTCQGWVAGRSKGCRNNKKYSSWRLRLLRKLAADTLQNVQLLSLKNIPKPEGFGQLYMEGDVSKGSDSLPHLPNIKCTKDDEMIPCPSANSRGEIYCINRFKLCDSTLNCPNGEDENLELCMFYKATKLEMYDLWETTSVLAQRIEDVENSGIKRNKRILNTRFN